MSERSTSTRRLNTNDGRSFSSSWRYSEAWEAWESRVPDGQTVPLGGRWAREERRRELRRSAEPVHHAAVTRPSGRELLYVLGVVALVPLGWFLAWLVAT